MRPTRSTSARSPDGGAGGDPSLAALPLLRADCSACVGLCCVALPTTASADFGATKPAGVPCRHLRGDDSCEIHDQLRDRGWRGCVVFDCFGAGQRLTSALGAAPQKGGRPVTSWRDLGESARAQIFTAFGSLRTLHEAAYHLLGTLEGPDGGLSAEARAELVSTLHAIAAAIDAPLAVPVGDADALRRRAGAALAAASGQLRSARRASGAWPGRLSRGVGPGADLLGRRLRGRDLRTADLRGALLVGADLREADLRWADLLGADLRDADLRGADLRGALFVSPPQLEAATGNAVTRLPHGLSRPRHWR